MKTSIPSFQVEIRIEQKCSGFIISEYRQYIQRFIQSFNETWDTHLTYQDLIEIWEGDETTLFANLKNYLESAIEQIISESIEDEFLNGLNFELTKCKNKKEMNV